MRASKKRTSRKAVVERSPDLPIKPVGEVKNSRSWAIYGRSGAGKTTFASTFPKPILFLDIKDRGTDSIADVPKVDVMAVETWDDIEDVYWYLKENPNKYKTVVFDTVSQLQQLCTLHVLANNKKASSRAGDWGSMTRREWGDASAMMKEKITSFRDLPFDTVFIAQEKTSVEDDADTDETLLVPEVGPAVMKSVAGHLNASVSIIGHSFIRLHRTKREVRGKKVTKEETRFCLRIGPNPIYTTKIRKPKSVEPPAYIEDPTYDDVVDIIEGEE